MGRLGHVSACLLLLLPLLLPWADSSDLGDLFRDLRASRLPPAAFCAKSGAEEDCNALTKCLRRDQAGSDVDTLCGLLEEEWKSGEAAPGEGESSRDFPDAT